VPLFPPTLFYLHADIKLIPPKQLHKVELIIALFLAFKTVKLPNTPVLIPINDVLTKGLTIFP